MHLGMYLAHPIIWLTGFYQQRFGSDWDKELNRIMDSDPNPQVGEHTCTFKVDGREYQVWSSNRFYAYAHIYRIDGETVPRELWRRPKLRTMLRFAGIEREKQEALKNEEIRLFIKKTGFKSL